MLWEVVRDELGGLAHRTHSIPFSVIGIRDQLIKTHQIRIIFSTLRVAVKLVP